MTERLASRTQDLEVQGSSLARHIVSLDKELYSSLSLFTRVYKWAPATPGGGGGNPAMELHPIQNATELNWKEAPSM